MTKALIVVDVQVDFCEGGSLAVEGGNSVAERITQYCKDHRDEYDVFVATKDDHHRPGRHFASYDGNPPDFVSTWPDHCVTGTPGAEYSPSLQLPPETIHFAKGQRSAAYSGFEANVYDPWNDRSLSLNEYLQLCKVDEIDVVGLATDYCVKATAMDSIAFGYKTRVLTDMVAAVNQDTGKNALQELADSGATLVA